MRTKLGPDFDVPEDGVLKLLVLADICLRLFLSSLRKKEAG